MITYSEYWETVLGPRTPDQVVREFSLTPDSRSLDEWLGTAEEEAFSQMPRDMSFAEASAVREATMDEWASHHSIALDALLVAATREAKARHA